MGDTNSDWITDSNEAMYISLVTPTAEGVKSISTFRPHFTYHMFGPEEQIFGYQDLKIHIKFNACDMRPGLRIMYSKKFTSVGETKATDLKAILAKVLPKTAFTKPADFQSTITETDYTNFQPPGQLWQTIEAGGETYEVWRGGFSDVAIQQLIKRIQVLVPFYIEGGTFIDLQHTDWTLERWNGFFLYHKKKKTDPKVSPYVFMGYATTYRFPYYKPTPKPDNRKLPIVREATATWNIPFPDDYLAFADLPCRSRISQFVILPTFYKGGHGSRLYKSIFDFFFSDASTIELTVEDPNQEFDDVRDINDLIRLRADPEFAALRINKQAVIDKDGVVPHDILDKEQLEKMRKRFKLVPRQFARMVEMQLLSLIDPGIRQSLDDKYYRIPDFKNKLHEYKLWELMTKERLYRHNKVPLAQLERLPRIDKLEEVLATVEGDYARLLRALDKRKLAEGGVEPKFTTVATSSKRPPPEAPDSEEPASKKAKLA